MIAVINYEMGNVGSVLNMMRKLRIQAKLTRDPKDLNQACGIILPGVGSYDRGMKQLRKCDLVTLLEDLVIGGGKPCLGICLGMQLMAGGSEEGVLEGLGWIQGTVCKFQPDPTRPKLRIPHMGWNYVKPADQNHWLFTGLPSAPRFYFVHSYFYPANVSSVAGITEHIMPFASVVAKGNIVGCQFHPEKSHFFGLTLLSNFARMAMNAGESGSH
jgi:glutamine amidotransferase